MTFIQALSDKDKALYNEYLRIYIYLEDVCKYCGEPIPSCDCEGRGCEWRSR